MKQKIIKLLRKKLFQGIWEKLHHFAKVGMNYWGGASLYESGEISVLHYIHKKHNTQKEIVIFDVGANIGTYSLLSYDIFDRENVMIFSFEPSIHTYKTLVENTQHIDAIRPINIGFGEISEKLKLYSSGKESVFASVYNLNNQYLSFKDEYSEEIIITTIDSFCKDFKIESIDFLKIDIEGHELYALKGAKELIKNNKIKFIQFEFGECHIDSRTFFKDFYDLFNKEYLFYRVVSDGLREIKTYSTDLEIFNTANFLIELKDSSHKT
jgi:FkbM family methyltransferase